jgi:radical SAM protein with 4Fe4S-binding SPASM domain
MNQPIAIQVEELCNDQDIYTVKVGSVIKMADKKHKIVSWMNIESGFYVRTDNLVMEDEKFQQICKRLPIITPQHLEEFESGHDSFMASFPSLIDVGIMGNCIHGAKGLCAKGGIQCYQDGRGLKRPNMSVEDFTTIVEEGKGKLYQIALGGRGDPNKHEDFAGIVKACTDRFIVPNYTTSGLDLSDEEVAITKKSCGAVAVSWYRQQHTIDAIQKFIAAGVKTNIHYVLAQNTIDEAITRLTDDDFPDGINAIIFLLHKPVGLGQERLMLSNDDPRLKRFFELVDGCEHPFKIGFDSCTIPGIINNTSMINEDSIDTCEGGRWSMYIDSEMNALPCSFDNQDKRWAVNLKEHTIQETWDGKEFESFRSHFKKSCPECNKREACMGGCPIVPQIVLCDRPEKDNMIFLPKDI